MSVARLAPGDPELVVSSSCLGGGGFAAVYRGTFRGAPVAVKVPVAPTASAEELALFTAEALALERANGHPNIVRLVAVNAAPPRPVLVMEACRGSLRDAIHGPGAGKFASAPLRARLAMAVDAATALAHLHGLRPAAIVHRDVSSGNFLFSAATGRLVLADFGLAGVRAADAGAPPYMPPEAWASKAFGTPTDVFSDGVLLWELLSGTAPWAGWAPADVRAAVLDRGDRPPLEALPSGTPPALRELITRCWAADPTARPTMAFVLEELSAIAAALPAAASTPAAGDARGSRGPGASASAPSLAEDSLGAAMARHVSGGGAGKAAAAAGPGLGRRGPS